jgi:uncharacterized protein (DUF1810 family)
MIAVFDDASTPDPYDLNGFLQAQQNDYQRALLEIRSGRKRSHWMWYIFPQFAVGGDLRSTVSAGSETRAERNDC